MKEMTASVCNLLPSKLKHISIELRRGLQQGKIASKISEISNLEAKISRVVYDKNWNLQ